MSILRGIQINARHITQQQNPMHSMIKNTSLTSMKFETNWPKLIKRKEIIFTLHLPVMEYIGQELMKIFPLMDY